MLQRNPFGILLEAYEFAAAQHLHIGVSRQQILELGLEIGLVEEIAHCPAIRTIKASELTEHGAVLKNPLYRGIEHHIGFEIGGDAGLLENPHAFVIGIDGPRVAIEFWLAL